MLLRPLRLSCGAWRLYTLCKDSPGERSHWTIRRVQCSLCKVTHALLPSTIVPYSQIPLAHHAAIASSYEDGNNGMEVMDTNPELSPSQVFYILSLYIRFWRQRLLSERIPLSPAHALAKPCIRLFGRQFMQIKNTRNILFSPPT